MTGELLTEAAFEVSLRHEMVTWESLRTTEWQIPCVFSIIIKARITSHLCRGSESSVLTPPRKQHVVLDCSTPEDCHIGGLMPYLTG
jgi:hypothetical protein